MSLNHKKVIESLDQKPYDSHYLYLETIIDQPVEKVWPHALNIGSWMTAHRLETIDGEPGDVGHFERVFPRGIGDQVPLPHYHLYGIAEVIPYKLIALEVFPERGGSYGKVEEWMSFDNILFVDMVERTCVIFLMVDAHLEHADPDGHQRRKKEVDEARPLVTRYFENLKQLIT
jgi:hypothetical protein